MIWGERCIVDRTSAACPNRNANAQVGAWFLFGLMLGFLISFGARI